MRIKKFRLAEAFALAFLAAGMVIGSTADWKAAASDPSASLELSVPAAYLAAIGALALSIWLARDAIRRRPESDA